MVRVVEGDIVILPPVVRFCWTPPDSYDQLMVTEGMLRTSQLNSALPPTATVIEGRGAPNSGWPEREKYVGIHSQSSMEMTGRAAANQ